MMKVIRVATLASLGLTACDLVPFTPASRIQEAKARISIQSSDPTTVQWSDVKEWKGNVCGVVNMQKRIGYAEPEWTGALHFVTQKGEPTTVDDYSDCDTVVRDYAACSNQGDAGKVTDMVEQCRIVQAELDAEQERKVAARMSEAGLIATGDAIVDQEVWMAKFNATRMTQMGGYNDPKDQVRWNAGDRFVEVYNQEMRKLPDDATEAQKVTASHAAKAEGTRQAEAVLKAGGVV